MYQAHVTNHCDTKSNACLLEKQETICITVPQQQHSMVRHGQSEKRWFLNGCLVQPDVAELVHSNNEHKKNS